MKIILLIVCLAIGGTMSARRERSFGGTRISIKDASFFVSIKKNNEHKCGGTLITERHVLSAVICVVDTWSRLDYEHVVISGSDTKYGGGIEHQIALMVAIQENVQSIFLNDLVVLELSNNVAAYLEGYFLTLLPIGPPSLYESADLIAFESATDPKENTYLHEMGVLLYADESSDSHAVAGRTYPKMFRVYEGHGQSRQEDTGGPLVQNGILIGIASSTIMPADSSRDFISVYRFRNQLKHLIPTLVILE